MEFFIPVFFGFLVQAVIFGFLCQSLCEKKGHDGGFLIGFFFGILGLLYVVGLPDKSGSKNINKVIKRSSKLCPYCGGELEGQYELCKHCRSPLSYVEGVPCKPGLESSIKEDIERAAKEHYESQKLTFSTRDGVDYVLFKCYCGHSLSTKCSNIGSKKQCPKCHKDLLIIGEKEYREDKNISYVDMIILIAISSAILLILLVNGS
jgi:hypothetical protein